MLRRAGLIDAPTRAGSARLRVAYLGALAVACGACSLAFDATDLTDGRGTTAAGTGGATSTATTSAIAGGAGGAGGDGDGAASPSATTGGGGGGDTGTSGGAAGEGGAGGGNTPCTPTFCETEGADATWCKDFDGENPLGGVQSYEPDGDTVTTTIEVVDDPTHSCPSAVSVRVEADGAFDPTYAVLGVDVPVGDDRFTWSFWVHRVSTGDDLWLAPTAFVAWTSGVDTGCQAYLFMRDEDGQSRVRFYTQGYDGGGWVGTGEADVFAAHPSIGAWTHVEMDVDLTTDPGSFVLRVDGEETGFAVDALCGPSIDGYEARVGSFYTEHPHATVYDDVTLRVGP